MVETSSDYMTATEAADFLGVSKATLYSYVSRGMLASLELEPGARHRSYRRADLAALKHRSTFRKNPDLAATEVIEFGTPILATAISQITEAEHSYRGVSSRELARRYSFEQVAEYLWTGEPAAAPNGAPLPPPRDVWRRPIDPGFGGRPRVALSPVERLQAVLPLMEKDDLHAYGVKPAVLLPAAARIVLQLAAFASGTRYGGSLAGTLADAWGADAAKLDALLVLVADHELNIATFTARCAASAGASIYQAVLAGLAALQGYKHLYGQVAEARAFFAEVVAEGGPAPVVRRYLRQRGVVPGFHNPYRRLYAGNDPRVAALVELLADSPRYPLLRETLDVAEAATGEHPRVDFALAVAEPLLELPEDAIFSLIALGRTAGMIAHVFEQYASERVIRPRARYVPRVG